MKLLAFYNFAGEVLPYHSFKTEVDQINDSIKIVIQNKLQNLYNSGEYIKTHKYYLIKNDKTQLYTIQCEVEDRTVIGTIKLGYLENMKSIKFTNNKVEK